MNFISRPTWHCGFHTRGNCWKFRFSIFRYHTCTHYVLWRFYVAIDKTR